LTGPRETELRHVEAVDLRAGAMSMPRAVGMPMHRLSLFYVFNWAKRRVRFRHERGLGSLDGVQANDDVRSFDELARFCKPKGEAIRSHDEFRSRNQRLKDIVRSHGSMAAGKMHGNCNSK